MDTKKLERAEQQLQKKQDKRDGGSSAGGSAVYYKGSGSEGEATASQAISRRDENACEGGTITKDIRIENFDISFGDKVSWEFLISTGKLHDFFFFPKSHFFDYVCPQMAWPGFFSMTTLD